MSASTTPTRSPCCAIATARFAVTDDLPTPPLPDATANTFVSEVGLLNGITGSAPPRSRSVRAARCSGLITPSAIRTSATPSTVRTAAVTSWVMVSRSGQPAVVRSMPTVTSAPAAGVVSTSTDRTMPRSVIGRRISGSSTRVRASRTAAATASGSRVSRAGDMPSIVGAPAGAPAGTCPLRGRGRAVPLAGAVPVARVGRVVRGLALGGRLPLLGQLLQQVPQLGPDEVAGGDLGQRDAQRRHLARQELGVGEVPLRALPVLLGLHPVAVGLPVLREQD